MSEKGQRAESTWRIAPSPRRCLLASDPQEEVVVRASTRSLNTAGATSYRASRNRLASSRISHCAAGSDRSLMKCRYSRKLAVITMRVAAALGSRNLASSFLIPNPRTCDPSRTYKVVFTAAKAK